MKSRLLRFVSVSILAILISAPALASDGSSGCGPGWYLMQDTSLVSSALRGTTNWLLFPVVTIGMTFGTSNCTQHKIVLKEKETLYFATMNHFELKADLAKGHGEYLSAFASTMGCPATAQVRLNDRLRANYSKVYPTSTVKPDDVVVEVYKTIFEDVELTQKCSLGAA
ncbi:MAG: DUF3015 family protein [Bdellovibrionota bacterium]